MIKFTSIMLTIHKKRKLEVISAYGGKCQCPGGCNITFPEFLSADHVNGGGKRDVKESIGALYKRIVDKGFPKDEFRLLCLNCNWSFGAYGYCPHQRTDSPAFSGSPPMNSLCVSGGRDGGKSKSEAKKAAVRANLAIARASRWPKQ